MTEATSPEPSKGWARAAWTPSDDRLARRATRGDQQAFEAIYERYHQDLYRYCLAILGDPQDAQDTLQNTMVKVLRALPGEERRIQLKPWLYRIARNEAIETMRRRRESAEIEPDGLPSPANLEIAETAETRDRLRRLITDLGELPERQRSALVMRELSGLGFAQIGAAFHTSEAVARQTIYEARRSLRLMEAGREMSCDQVMRELSDADGRVTRRRELRAHLRSCENCRLFRKELAQRRGDLAAIAPLPLAVSAGVLHGVLTGKASAASAGAGAGLGTGAGAGSGGGLASTLGAGAGKAVATSALVKSAATVAVVAAVGVSAADRSGLIHIPIPGVSQSSKSAAPHGGSGGTATNGASPPLETPAASSESGSSAGHGGGAGAAGARQDQGALSHSAAGQSHRHQRRAHHHAHHGRPAELPPASEPGQGTAEAHSHRPPPEPKPHPAQSGGSAGGEPAPKQVPPSRESAPAEPAPPDEPAAGGRGNAVRGHSVEEQELKP